MKVLTDEQIEEIKRLNEMGFNDANIADFIGVARWNVARCRKKMKLPKNSPYTAMSTEKKRRTMGRSLRENTGDRMNYRTMAHELRAMQLGWPDYKLGEALILHVLEKNGGCATLVEILEEINLKKASRGWKPPTTSKMFFHYAAMLKEKGLLVRHYGTGDGWRGPRTYVLTERAYEEARRLRTCLGSGVEGSVSKK